MNDRALLRHFALSWNKSLRTLEITAESIDAAGDSASDFLKTILSSVTPSAPLDVVVIYREFDFSRMPHCSRRDSKVVRLLSDWPLQKLSEDIRFQHQFRTFREMHSVRGFRLVLCVDVFDCMVEDCIETLEEVVKAEKVMGGLD